MERLTAEDRVMLWPGKTWPQEIGALAVLDGGGLLDPDGRFRVEAVRQVIEARLHQVPRFRQLLYLPRRGLGGPVWVDAPAFDLTDHVRVAPLPAPGDEAALLLATERLRRPRLDWSRPLWQIWFLPGLPDRRVGMFVKIHHVIADGVAGVATVGAFLDATPDVTIAPARPWTPAPAPTARDLLADDLRRHAHELGRACSALARPAATARQAHAAWRAMREMSTAEPAPATSLNRMVGADRRLAPIRSGLDQARGNLIGQFVVSLPVAVPDPGRRLAQIAAKTTAAKAEPHLSVGTVLRSRIVRRALVRVMQRQPVNVTSTDVPGPPFGVYLAGARLLEVFPVLPLAANVSLGVGAMSYAGQFNIMAIADQGAYPDFDVFAASAEDELRALAASA